ncbi:YggS family pyridoxal phosphate-dependent enzyme [Haloplasma contractile]|uniref:Pyridoxal phosphate homeostasis protein n=1 Tax=Haloplasma contractile SSD-17B TaxID=1033810 RepID=U2FRM0_9MOLU|nr:YggS family pyridoxal phosphate-dependent enzyme [Haloplasma contractile]ERJ13609.1 alanine racemase protein [Haloplasma contractile SSD-17B]
MDLKRNIEALKKEVDEMCTSLNLRRKIEIVAATKYVSSEIISKLYYNGIKHVGENRVNVFLEKYDRLHDLDLTWHFIGSLQSKKVKKVINKVDYLHSLDRESLAVAIEKHAVKKVKCFVQVNTSEENSKHGLLYTEALSFIKKLRDYQKIEVVGLMTMAPLTDDEEIIKNTFSRLKELQEEIQTLKLENVPCKELSMGMSNDYLMAIEEGATYLRIGSRLFK